MAGLTFSPGTLETALAVSQEPGSIAEATGLAGVGPSSADIVKARDAEFERLQQTAAQSLASMRRPPSPQSIIAFSPSANKFYAGGLTFSPDDVPSALQASQRLSQPTPPAPGNIAGDWQFVSPQEFGQYMQSLRAPRGVMENIGLGLRSGAEGAIGGVGRLAELAGATQAGPAIAGFAERAFGQTPQEQARSALIQQSNSLWSNILDATAQGVGSLVPTVLGGVAGAAVGSAIGGPGGAAVGAAATAASAASRSVGALVGVAAATFPMEYKGFYDAAQKNGYNVNDPNVQTTMFASAVGTTLLQSLAPATVIKGLSGPFREAVEATGQQVARGALRNAATGAAKGSLQEGFAEAISSLAQNVVFDPEFRRKMNANDWKVIGPYVAEKYGEEALISFGAGALLGGALGGATNMRRTEPVNLNDRAADKAAELEQFLQERGPEAASAMQAAGLGQFLQERGPEAASAMQAAGLGQFLQERGPEAASAMQAAGLGQLLAQRGPEAASAMQAAGLGQLLAQRGPEIAAAMQAAPAPAPAPAPTPAPTTTAMQAAELEQFLQERGPEAATTMRATGLERLLAQRGPQAASAMQAASAPTPEPTPTPTPAPTSEPTPAQDPRTPAAKQAVREVKVLRADANGVRIKYPSGDITIEAPSQYGRDIPRRHPGFTTKGKTVTFFHPDAGYQGTRAGAAFIDEVNTKGNVPPELHQVFRDILEGRLSSIEDITLAIRRARMEKILENQPVNLKRGATNAAQKGVQPEGGVSQREDAGEGRPSAKAGRGDSLKQRRKNPPAAEAQAEVTPEAAPTPAPAPAANITPEAVDLLAKVDAGGVPGMMTNNLRRIAVENGIQVLPGTTPGMIIDALRERAGVSAPAPAPAPEIAPTPASALPEGVYGKKDGTPFATSKAADLQLTAIAKRLGVPKDQLDIVELPNRAGWGVVKLDRVPTAPSLKTVTDKVARGEWAEALDDGGRGYDALPPVGKDEWKSLVRRGDITVVEAELLQQRYAPMKVSPRPPKGEAATPSKETAKAPAKKTSEAAADLKEVEGLIKELPNAADAREVGEIMTLLEEWARDSSSPRASARAKEFLAQQPKTGRFSLRGYNTVTGATGLNGQKLPPMAAGRVTMGVRRFLSNLATKPKVSVFVDQADLKAKNPALYRQAKAAAGPNVDFDAAPAAGYSFGDGNVIIFSGSIANDQHLNFVLAHETLGHFGMRGIMPGPKFNALMETLYDENPRIKAGVDNAMQARGLSKAEAVEEYLSDYAGMLETSVVLRVWNAIKGFLNKLGVRFGDEAMRYFLDQSKRYVRQGQQGVTFDAQAVADRLLYVETGANNTGRFSMGAVRTAHDQASEVLQALNPRQWTTFDEGYQALRALNITRREKWNDFLDGFTRLTNFKAMDNPGLYAFHQLLTAISQKSRFFLNKYDSELRSLMNASKAYQDDVSKVLFGGRNIAENRFAKNTALPKVRLLSLSVDGVPTVDRAQIAKLVRQYALTYDEAKNGTSETVEVTDSLGNIQRETATHVGIDKLTQAQYDDYIKALTVVANAEGDLLEAKYKALLDTDDVSRKAIQRILKDGDFKPSDAKFVDATVKEAKRIYVVGKTIDANGLEQLDPVSEKRSNDFLAAVNSALLGKDTDRNEEVAKFFASADAGEAYVKQLMQFKARRKSREELAKDGLDFTLQNQVKFLVLQSVNLDAAEYMLKKQIVTNNISVLREGGHETRAQAFVNGKPVELASEYQEKTVFSLFKEAGEATSFADRFNAIMQGKTFSAIVMENGVPVMRDNVTFRAIPGRSRQVATADARTNLSDFLHLLRRFDMVPDPKAMADIVTALTKATDNARKRMLEYSQTPGYDPTLGVLSLSTRVYNRANITAKTLYAPEMRRLMDRTDPEMDALWRGGRERVIALKKEVGATTGEAQVYAQRELDRALRQFKATNPDAKGKDGKPWDGSEANAPDLGANAYGRTEVYYNEAGRTMAALENTVSVAESELEASRAVSYIKAFTSLALLSLSPAQGALNISTAYTHWAPFMATYSANNAFGGGFGLGPTFAAYHRAMNQIGYRGIYADTKFNTAEFYDQVATDTRLQKQTGLNEREARFVAREIREGKLIPAQSNAMLSTALRHFTSPGLRKLADAIMTPFNYSEQAVRRGAGLAAYRLAYDRAVAAGKSEAVADAAAREFALESIDASFGDYDTLNRPPAWRQGIPGLLYMYKVFPTMTVQLMANLPRSGKIGMALGLWAVAGIGGLPFAEDAEDLIDTLAQKMNLTSRGLRIEMSKLLDEIVPGMSPYVFKGVVSTLLASPADIGSRLSMGDIIPGTGILLAGAKAAEEFKDIAGPAASVLMGLPAFAANVIRAPFSDTMTLETAARTSPITALRMLGDTSAYINNGAVVDKRGYVVSQDMSAATIITRLMGFYPSAAAEQYNVIKYANRMVNYQKEMTTTYREAWIRAKLRGDEAGAARIAENVVDWNDATRGTGLEMRNWMAGNNKALREASRPAGERALRAAPTAARQDIRGLMEAMLD